MGRGLAVIGHASISKGDFALIFELCNFTPLFESKAPFSSTFNTIRCMPTKTIKKLEKNSEQWEKIFVPLTLFSSLFSHYTARQHPFPFPTLSKPVCKRGGGRIRVGRGKRGASPMGQPGGGGRLTGGARVARLPFSEYIYQFQKKIKFKSFKLIGPPKIMK
jgi:hypothetical protein